MVGMAWLYQAGGQLSKMPNGFPEGLSGLSEKRIHVRRPLWAESEDSMFLALLAALLALSLTCCSATNCMGGSIVYNIVN
jgi:hypothetical protein